MPFPPAFHSKYILGHSAEVLTVWFDNDQRAIQAANSLIDRSERQKAARFIFERDRRKYVFWRACLRYFLGKRLAMPARLIKLVYGPYGKPALAPRYAGANLRFNLSHSGDLAIFAFSWAREVGVDLEAIRVLEESDDIAAQLFSLRECAAYKELDPFDRPLGFFNCWTRKEAFVKAIGNGLRYPLDRIEVSLAPGETPHILSINGVDANARDWLIESFIPASGFVASCVLHRST